jgi:hypothetical protein
MDSFEDELVKIGNELAEEYLLNETVKETVTENPEILDELIQKDILENLLMRRGDLEFLYALFSERKPKVMYVEIPIDPEKVMNQKMALELFLQGLPKKLTELGLYMNEVDYNPKEEHAKLEFYVGKEKNSMDIKIEYRHHITYDIIGKHKILISYPLGFEIFAEKIAEYLGAKLEPLSTGSKP